MHKTLTIFGASDDLIETAGLPGCDEFNSYNDSPLMGTLLVRSQSGNLNIHCIYDGGWAFAITTPDGDCDKYPDWKITRSFGIDCDYSETLTIECPEDAILQFRK